MDHRVIGERSDAVLRTAMPGGDEQRQPRSARRPPPPGRGEGWGAASEIVLLTRSARGAFVTAAGANGGQALADGAAQRPGQKAAARREPGFAGRRQRNFNVVVDALDGERPLREIEQHVAGAPVGAARRADRAGIDEVIGIAAELHRLVRQRHGLAAAKFVNRELMGVAESANPRARRMRDQRGHAKRASRVGVEPHRLAADIRVQRAMHGEEFVVDIGLEWQVGEERDIVVAQMLARPFDAARRRRAECFGGELSGYRAVVIAGDAQGAGGAQERDAFARPRVVADDIAEADNAIDFVRGNVVERGLQRLDIGVNLGKERELHGAVRSSRFCLSGASTLPGEKYGAVRR
jgi:hypothetical protein